MDTEHSTKPTAVRWLVDFREHKAGDVTKEPEWRAERYIVRNLAVLDDGKRSAPVVETADVKVEAETADVTPVESVQPRRGRQAKKDKDGA